MYICICVYIYIYIYIYICSAVITVFGGAQPETQVLIQCRLS